MAEKILIIDDDVDTLKLVGMMLQKQGYRIYAASNGKQGLSLADAEDPDLILLDVMMPEMDGYEVARQLRANPLVSNTPILMFTAKTQLDDKVAGFESGADDYLTKPTHPAELRAHVKALLARSNKGKTSGAAMPGEQRGLLIGVIAASGGQGVTTVAVNLADALRILTQGDVIIAELRPGMGTLGPELGENEPKFLSEILTTEGYDITRQKIKENLFSHKTGLRILFGSIHATDGLVPNAPVILEALVNRMSYLSPYLVLDLGAGLTPLSRKLIPACNIILVLVEPVVNSGTRARALLTDLASLNGSAQNIHAVLVNRIRTDTQINTAQMQGILGKAPLVTITPAPELMYAASRLKTTAFSTRPDSLTCQQFTQLAETMLEIEKTIHR